jgi:hypothetical protein
MDAVFESRFGHGSLIDPLFIAWYGPLQALPGKTHKAYFPVAQISSLTKLVFLALHK